MLVAILLLITKPSIRHSVTLYGNRLNIVLGYLPARIVRCLILTRRINHKTSGRIYLTGNTTQVNFIGNTICFNLQDVVVALAVLKANHKQATIVRVFIGRTPAIVDIAAPDTRPGNLQGNEVTRLIRRSRTIKLGVTSHILSCTSHSKSVTNRAADNDIRLQVTGFLAKQVNGIIRDRVDHHGGTTQGHVRNVDGVGLTLHLNLDVVDRLHSGTGLNSPKENVAIAHVSIRCGFWTPIVVCVEDVNSISGNSREVELQSYEVTCI